MKYFFRGTFLSLAVLFLSHSSHAQAGDELGTWFVFNGFYNINKRYELLMETQYRTWEPVHNTQTWFVRPFLSYRVTDNFLPGIGLEYHINRSFTDNDADRRNTQEFRLSLQSVLLQEVGTALLQHRYRYEFRFWDFDGMQRMRYRIQASIPVTSRKIEPGVWFATFGNEFLIDTQPGLTFSQDWMYAMAGYRFAPALFLQAGYLHIFLPDSPDQHRLQILFIHRLFLGKDL